MKPEDILTPGQLADRLEHGGQVAPTTVFSITKLMAEKTMNARTKALVSLTVLLSLLLCSMPAFAQQNSVMSPPDGTKRVVAHGDKTPKLIHASDPVWLMSFGAPLEDQLSEATAERVRKGLNAVRPKFHR